MIRPLVMLFFSIATSTAIAAAHSNAPADAGKDSSTVSSEKTDKDKGAKTSVERARDTSNHSDADKADNQKPRSKAGSAAGVTGGPAATGGHTGSTNNPSNSPNK